MEINKYIEFAVTSKNLLLFGTWRVDLEVFCVLALLSRNVVLVTVYDYSYKNKLNFSLHTLLLFNFYLSYDIRLFLLLGYISQSMKIELSRACYIVGHVI